MKSANFKEDHAWEQTKRGQLLRAGYWGQTARLATQEEDKIQGIDIFTSYDSFQLKIVRWAGRKYPAYFFETHSDLTKEGGKFALGKGSFLTSEAGVLDYCFEEKNGGFECHRFRDFKALQHWFTENYEGHEISDVPNKLGDRQWTTRGRKVPFKSLPRNLRPEKKRVR